MNTANTQPCYATFSVLRLASSGLASSELAGRAASQLTGQVGQWARHATGFISGRIHQSMDGATLVSLCHWASAAAFQQAGAFGTGSFGTGAFEGAEIAAIEGPAAGEPTGVAAIATRHVGGREAARSLADLLRQSGEWKRHVPGFIAATAYLSADGRTYVNYPRWVSLTAYQSYMADPRIENGQRDIARLEVAAPEFILCRVIADIEAPKQKEPSRDHHVAASPAVQH